MLTGFISILFGLASSAFAAWDMTTVTTTFTDAQSELQSFIIVIVGALAVLWVGRKFIKSTNRS